MQLNPFLQVDTPPDPRQIGATAWFKAVNRASAVLSLAIRGFSISRDGSVWDGYRCVGDVDDPNGLIYIHDRRALGRFPECRPHLD